MIDLRPLLVGAALVFGMVGCGGGSVASRSPDGTGIRGTATAGPVCPVEKVPPDPDCAERAVSNATLVVRDGGGQEVARATTAADGTFFVVVPTGSYVVEPQPVDGLMGTAPPQDVTVGAGATTTITVVYDTGIRGPAVAPS